MASIAEQIERAERDFLNAADDLGTLLQRKGGPHNWAGNKALASLAVLNGGAIAITDEAFAAIMVLRNQPRHDVTWMEKHGMPRGAHIFEGVQFSKDQAEAYRRLMSKRMQEVDE